MREGPVNDMALLYYGGSHRPNQWENPALQSNVSYTDLDGVEHWLFDSFLFLEFNENNPALILLENLTGSFYNLGIVVFLFLFSLLMITIFKMIPEKVYTEYKKEGKK